MKEKHFREWIELKEKFHFFDSAPKTDENEIWWCSFGENVGTEINGKNKFFSRPVFICKKLSRSGFIGASLASQDKVDSRYVKFDFQEKKQVAVLLQIGTFSVAGLSSRMGKIVKNDSQKIRDSLMKFLE